MVASRAVKSIKPIGFAWLGASNFARCLPELADRLACERPGAPLISVCGHGRSYCAPSILGSRWLGRELPAIGEALRTIYAPDPGAGWSAERSNGFDVVLGDFGNDLAYGGTAREVLARAEELLRLRWRRVVVVEPPLDSVAALPAAAFRLAASILFPGRALRREDVLAQLQSLHGGLRRLAAEHDATWIDIPANWFGLDGIHVRRRHRSRFVRRLTEPLDGGPVAPVALEPLRWPPWWRRRPEREAIWWLGRRSERTRRPLSSPVAIGEDDGWVRFV